MSAGSKKSLRLPINQAIQASKVILIDADGTNKGVKPLTEALAYATQKKLDLVQMSEDKEPFPCRVMDYGKFVFNRKKERSATQFQRRASIKEIKFRIGTEKSDYDVKIRKLGEMLRMGHKTKITLRFRGREKQRPELGEQLFVKVREDLADIASVDQEMTTEQNQINMVLSLKKGIKRVKPHATEGNSVDGKTPAPKEPKTAADKPREKQPDKDSSTTTKPRSAKTVKAKTPPKKPSSVTKTNKKTS